MAKTKDEKNSDRRHKRAIARTKALGAVVHKDKNASSLRRRTRRLTAEDGTLNGVSGILGSTRKGRGGGIAFVTSKSSFYGPEAQLDQMITRALDADAILTAMPGPVTSPDMESSGPAIKATDAVTSPEMLALVNRAKSPEWKRRREQSIRRRHKASNDNTSMLISDGGIVTTRRYSGASVATVAIQAPRYLEFLLGVESAMSPKARRLTMLALAAAKRGLLKT